jgi:hypothetical protein
MSAAGVSLAEESKSIYRICAEWDTATTEDRRTAKEFMSRFIRYSFKMACVPSDSDDEEECPVPFVEIYVQSDARRKVTDWLEIQASGAVGVIFTEYKDPDKPTVGILSDACDEFNDAAGLTFAEHAGSDDEAEEEEEEAKVGGAAATEDSE